MITMQQYKKASSVIDQVVGFIEVIGNIIYCFICAVLVSFPLYALLQLVCFLDKVFDFVFAVPQDEKPTLGEIIIEEDKILVLGGAFND